jgi:hypothetical protein
MSIEAVRTYYHHLALACPDEGEVILRCSNP